MPTNVLHRHSLKIRITLTTLFVFLLSIWTLSYYASHALRVDMERLLGEQQYSTVTLLASQLDREMNERLRGLEGLAANVHPAIMENPASLQTFLEQHPYNQGLFNDGILAYNNDGVAVAIYPFAPERTGVNYMDRDYIIGALKQGKTTIGRPVIGKTLQAPIFAIAVPIRNFQGKVIGALSGITNLSKSNFLDKVTDNRYGKTGGYLLIDSRHRLVVTATDKSRIMEEQHDAVSNPQIESFYQGREGSAVYTNAQGVEVLASFKNIPEAGWQLGANLPVSEAFAPIDDMQRHMLLATLLLTLLAWSLGWWLLKRQLAPLLTTLETLGSMSDTQQPARALPIKKQDEIGQLIGGFNRLLETLAKREEALRESELQFKEIFNEVPIGYHEFDASARITRVNRTELESLGYTEEEMLGHFPWEFCEADALSQESVWAKLAGTKPPGNNFERTFVKKDGTTVPVLVKDKLLRDKDGKITGIRSVVMDITQRKIAEDEIKHLAFYDQLTGLPNRRLLFDRLEQSLSSRSRHRREGALLFLDLDNFKTLNDTLGHDKGDLLLQQVAKRLSSCMREGDTVARIGGDEFVVMLEDLSENTPEAATHAKAVGEKILAMLNATYQLDGNSYRSTASIGITLFANCEQSVDELIKQADLAMYQAKAAGRSTLRFFDPQMQAAVTKRAALEADLREAIAGKQFVLHYQAQVDLFGRVTGAEALLRWQHPERGLVYPDEFIGLAEETGLIVPIGLWVLETVCRQLATWSTAPSFAHLVVAVNVSPRQFRETGFVDQVIAILERATANAQRLKIEVTETLLVDDMEVIIGKMAMLKTVGVSFSLDDFGTGYSSLSYLKRMPLDQLKIDRSFVRDILIDPNDAAIARMVIVLAESLGLAIIAEGVETSAQREFLLQNGCPSYQGYFFSHPLPLEEFEVFAAQQDGDPGHDGFELLVQ